MPGSNRQSRVPPSLRSLESHIPWTKTGSSPFLRSAALIPTGFPSATWEPEVNRYAMTFLECGSLLPRRQSRHRAMDGYASTSSTRRQATALQKATGTCRSFREITRRCEVRRSASRAPSGSLAGRGQEWPVPREFACFLARRAGGLLFGQAAQGAVHEGRGLRFVRVRIGGRGNQAVVGRIGGARRRPRRTGRRRANPARRGRFR